MKKVMILLFALLFSGSAFADAKALKDCIRNMHVTFFTDFKGVHGELHRPENLDESKASIMNKEICIHDKPGITEGLTDDEIEVAILDGIVAAAESIFTSKEEKEIIEKWKKSQAPDHSPKKELAQPATSQNPTNISGSK